jgi:hypothetical protein
MKKCVPGFAALLLSSCLSAKVSPTTEDASFGYRQQEGQILLSSTSSALKTRIIRHQQTGDTLFVTYRKGAFLAPNARVPLTGQAAYLKCANRLYKVSKTASGFELSQR